MTVLRIEALILLRRFAVCAGTAESYRLWQSIGDIVGELHDGRFLIVKLKQSVNTLLTPQDVERVYRRDILNMRLWVQVRSLTMEIWVRKNEGSWQFFEVGETDVREVSH